MCTFLLSRSSSVLCVSMLMLQVQTARKLKVSLRLSWMTSWIMTNTVGTRSRVVACWLTAVSSTGVSGLTGLRVRLTELGDVPRLPGRALSRFYALKEMRVMGSCMCHGHANRCLPEAYNNPLPSSIQVCMQVLGRGNDTVFALYSWLLPYASS